MPTDEQSIRDLIAEWLSATAAGDVSKILSLMTDNVVFLIARQPPVRGRDAFAAAFQAGIGKVRIEPKSTVQETQVAKNFACCWNHLRVDTTPLQSGSPMRRSGYTLTGLRKERDAQWVVFRDANTLMPERSYNSI